MEFNFDKIFKNNGMTEEVKTAINTLKFPDNMNMVTIMENTQNNYIKVTSYFENWKFPTVGDEKIDKENKELQKFTKLMNTSPQLQGLIDTKGKIKLFFLEQKQKNLIALMHEFSAVS